MVAFYERGDKIKGRGLSKVKLKTLLIFYPTTRKTIMDTPLAVPTLKSFLISKNYKKLRIAELQTFHESKIKRIKFYFYYRFLNHTYKFRFEKQRIKNILYGIGYFIQHGYEKTNPDYNISLNSIIVSAFDKIRVEKYKNYQNVKSLIERCKPDLVGFSVNFPEQIYYSLVISNAIKSLDKNIFIVMGGSQITKNIERLIKTKGMAKLVDGFVINEGEEPISELIYQLEHSKKLGKVPNLYFKNGRGSYRKSKTRFCCNSDYIFAPNFDGLKPSNIPLHISFGCPWGRCSFCSYRLLHKKYSCAKVEKIIEIIKFLKAKYKVDSFSFVDDCLTPIFLRDFSKALLKNNIKIFWGCFVALLPGFNTSTVKLMTKSGCRQVFIGLESMSPRILKLMNKAHSPEMAKKILNLFENSGIFVNVGIIFGFPTESEKEVLTTFNFIKNNRNLFDEISIQQFCLEDDTLVFKNPRKFGITKIYKQDKNHGIRLGYRYETSGGMTQEYCEKFAEEARNTLRKYGCNVPTRIIRDKIDIEKIKNNLHRYGYRVI